MLEIYASKVDAGEEAEIILKISQSTMIRLMKKSMIPTTKIGAPYRILGSPSGSQFLLTLSYETARTFYPKARKKLHSLEIKMEKKKLRNTDTSISIRKQ